MSWQRLQDKLHYVDGSWRDIYVQRIIKKDWGNWINFVNATYQVSFYNGVKQTIEDQIDENVILAYWSGEIKYPSSAVIILGKTQINCRYFYPDVIENDFDPKEITCLADHDTILEYMAEVSKLLRKKVILTPENLPLKAYVSVYYDKVEIIS